MFRTKKLSRNHRTRDKVSSLPSAVISGFSVALGGGMLLLLIFTLILSKTANPTDLSGVLSLIALYIGCTVGGFAAMKKATNSSGYTASAISALSMSTISLASNLICNGPKMSFITTVGYYVGIFAAFLAGAFLGRRRQTRTNHHRKK